MKRKPVRIGTLAFFVAVGIAWRVSAAQNNWTGNGGDGLWTNAANWSLGVAPDSTHDVTISDTGINGVSLNDSAEVATLLLGGGTTPAILSITSGTLTCDGTTYVQTNGLLNLAGQLTTGGQLTLDGVLNWSGGSLAASSIIIDPSGNLSLVGTSPLILSGNLQNRGMISCSAMQLALTPGSQLNNYSLFFLYTNLLITSSTAAYPNQSLYNSGTILVPAGSGTVSLTSGCWLHNISGTIQVATNAVLELGSTNGADMLFQDTQFNGPGVVRFAGTNSCCSYFSCDGYLAANTTVELAGGYGDGGHPTWSGSGLFRWLSGSLRNHTFGSGFHVEMSGPDPKTMIGCTNLGTVKWLGGSSLVINGSGFVNYGQFILQTNLTLVPQASPNSSLNNQGTVLAPAGSGTLSLLAGTVLFNQGTIRAETNTVLQLSSTNSGYPLFLDGTVLDGPGLIQFPDGTYFSCDGTLRVNTTVEMIGGYANGGQPIWTGPGQFRWLGGTLQDFTFGLGFQVEASGAGVKVLSQTCTNYGSLRWTADSALYSADPSNPYEKNTFVNGGLLSLETNCQWDAAIKLLNLPGGTVRQRGGSPSLGSLTNNGSVEFYQGLLNLGSFNSSPGSTCTWILAGTAAGQDYGQLNAANLVLGGTLQVVLTNAFVTASGNAFTLVTNLLRVGQFASTFLPPLLPPLHWRLNYAANAIVLKCTSPPALAGASRLPDGSFRFVWTDAASSGYVIQTSTNLADWITVATNTLPASLSFTDTNATLFDHRFYRVQTVD